MLKNLSMAPLDAMEILGHSRISVVLEIDYVCLFSLLGTLAADRDERRYTIMYQTNQRPVLSGRSRRPSLSLWGGSRIKVASSRLRRRLPMALGMNVHLKTFRR